ncbi:YnbE family lipoprotein [Klebsiella pneumoniae]|nr:YnbE family lipoprotein [Klebsiella pneumoniae]
MKKLLLAMVASMLLAGCTPRIEIAASKRAHHHQPNVKIELEGSISKVPDGMAENLLKSRNDCSGRR